MEETCLRMQPKHRVKVDDGSWLQVEAGSRSKHERRKRSKESGNDGFDVAEGHSCAWPAGPVRLRRSHGNANTGSPEMNSRAAPR